MRPIKFRAWAWDTRYPDEKKASYILDVLGIDFAQGKVLLPYKIEKVREAELDDINLMQFTGLKDKNGKEIYEGDLVKHFSKNAYGWSLEYVLIGEPKLYGYIKGKDVWGIHFNDTFCLDDEESYKDFEVIGNIYENKELLNVESNTTKG